MKMFKHVITTFSDEMFEFTDTRQNPMYNVEMGHEEMLGFQIKNQFIRLNPKQISKIVTTIVEHVNEKVS